MLFPHGLGRLANQGRLIEALRLPDHGHRRRRVAAQIGAKFVDQHISQGPLPGVFKPDAAADGQSQTGGHELKQLVGGAFFHNLGVPRRIDQKAGNQVRIFLAAVKDGAQHAGRFTVALGQEAHDIVVADVLRGQHPVDHPVGELVPQAEAGPGSSTSTRSKTPPFSSSMRTEPLLSWVTPPRYTTSGAGLSASTRGSTAALDLEKRAVEAGQRRIHGADSHLGKTIFDRPVQRQGVHKGQKFASRVVPDRHAPFFQVIGQEVFQILVEQIHFRLSFCVSFSPWWPAQGAFNRSSKAAFTVGEVRSWTRAFTVSPDTGLGVDFPLSSFLPENLVQPVGRWPGFGPWHT